MGAEGTAIIEAAGTIAPHGDTRRVFVIDDDPVMLLSCRRILEKDGYQVETCDSAVEGLRRIEESRPELLLVDLKMPELNGLQVIERVRAIDADIVIAVITGYATIATAVDAMQAGAYDFLPKPFTPDELRLIVNRGHERWRLAAESARLRHEKEEAERRFITFVSHQLKTPVVAAKQYLDVLLYTSREEMSPQILEWLGRAQSRLDEMLGIIRDWLELARIGHASSGEGEATCELSPVLSQVVDALMPQALAAGVTLHLEGACEAQLAAGAGDVTTVLANLVSNGIKYNKVGGNVTVKCRTDAGFVTIEVTDTGIGMPADALPHLFEEFYRIRTDQTRNIPGSGLGLAICQRLVSAVGGQIAVESRLGEGTTISVRIPAARQVVSSGDPA